ncbi:MAG: hypothetical protein UFX72_02320 [Adlercreutzia sp.]|nr:hypothetical protein [Adlercreutzia sp.]
MNSKIKLVGSTLGAVALLAPAAAAALPLEAQATDSPAAVVSVEQAAAIPGVSSVQGVFTYDQDAVVSTRAIAEVFHRAAAALCTGLPQYEVDGQGGVVCVKSPGAVFSATVQDMTEEEGVSCRLIGCSCASNGPGGGAVMNADVSGVALAAVAAMARI